MRRIYWVTLGSSLVQATICGLFFISLGYQGFLLAGTVTLLAVWLGLLTATVLLRSNKVPNAGMAAIAGAVLGALSALEFCVVCWLHSFGPVLFVLLIGLIGVIVGLPLGLVNYVIWDSLGLFSKPTAAECIEPKL